MDRNRCIVALLANLQLTDINHADLPQWWQNRRSGGGMRLSQWGHQQLAQLSAPNWRFEIDPAWITPRNMLRMDRLIPVPYSLDHSARPRRSWVTVWDSGQAMTIELLGDFDRFLAALERAWSRS
jgi:hypothetical protein